MGRTDRVGRKGQEPKQEGQNEHHRDFDDANGDVKIDKIGCQQKRYDRGHDAECHQDDTLWQLVCKHPRRDL